MTAIVKSKHRVRLAKDYLENLEGHPVVPPETEGAHQEDRNHYLFIGKSRPWPVDLLSVPPTSDVSPPAPLDTVDGDYRAWDNMIALKKITQGTSSLVIPRNNWDATGETVYAQYDHRDPNLHLHPTSEDAILGNTQGYTPGGLYVITTDFHVFKCLSNNGGAKSTEKPTLPGGPPWIIQTSDGYVWKYMYSVTPSLVERFVTDQWIPIETKLTDDGSLQYQVQLDAIDGSIDSFVIDNPGNGYTFIHQGKALQSATSTTAIVQSDAISNDVDADTQFVGCTIFITSGAATGEFKQIVSYDHTTQQATLDSAWGNIPAPSDTYDLVPTVVIDGDGTNLTGKAIINESNNELESIQIIDSGQDYRFASVTLSGGLSLAGSHASVSAALSPIGGHGSDAENELGAFYVLLNARLEFDEEDFPLANDYRQVGIIRNVLDNFDVLATQDNLSAVKKLIVTGYAAGIGGAFQPDEQISGDDTINPIATGKIVQFTDLGGGNAEITFWQDNETGFIDFLPGMTLAGAITSSSATVASIDDREVKKNSGEIIWLEHRRPILRAPDQIEDIKVILEF